MPENCKEFKLFAEILANKLDSTHLEACPHLFTQVSELMICSTSDLSFVIEVNAHCLVGDQVPNTVLT